MRITGDGFNLSKILRFNSQRMIRIVTIPLTNGYRRIRKYLNPNGISTKVMGDVRKGFKKTISAKPSSLKDYYALSNYYVAKKLVFVIVLLMILLPILYIKYAHPNIKAHFFTATMTVNAAEMQGYTGKVRLLLPSNGQLVYEGTLSDGRVTGEGVLYDLSGNMVYRGGFLLEMYEGDGESFFPNGQTQYKGAFAKNSYEGFGSLYREDGSLRYKGEFSGGLYEGAGKEYYSNGMLRYEGDFADNKYQGSGKLYDSSGRIIYIGEFKDGVYDGQGVLYENGAVLYEGQFALGKLNGKGKIFSGEQVLYEGEFSDNQYNGAGKAYDPVTGTLIYDGNYENGKYSGSGKIFDPQTSNLIYEGEFYDGNYEGDGKLFDPETGYPLYEGGFRLGRFDGEGTQYDSLTGIVSYKGGFLLDSYNGEGSLYDPASGALAAQGVFQSGALLFSNEAAGETGDEAGAPAGEETGGAAGDETGGAAGDEIGGAAGDETGAANYTGPTADGGVDYFALASSDAKTAQASFTKQGTEWDLAEDKSVVYEDAAENLGLTLQLGKDGKLIGVDIWNDTAVKGVKIGMTRAELDKALGSGKEAQEDMGEMRMVSISQSNRFHGRMTNLSTESKVTVVKYKTDSGVIQAVFAAGIEECLLLEVRK